jgi:hypothetical protein
MERFEFRKQTSIHTDKQWSWKFPIYGNVSRPRLVKSYGNTKNNNNKFSNRYNVNLHTIIKKLCLLLATSVVSVPAYAEVGGISATANPIANSSGSVTNQAIQVLQGPYITNTYGNGIQCQGATMNVTPYLTGTGNFKRPFEHTYMDPVYDMSDLNDDGVLDNPGSILYYVPTRTGQQEVYNISGGISATWSRPLDKEAREKCIEAAETQIAMQKQLTANKRLDFELARLKNCGEQMKAGVMFHPKSPFYAVCADVVLVNPPGVVQQHTHEIKTKPPVSTDAGVLKEISIGNTKK